MRALALALMLCAGSSMADETVMATDFSAMDWRLESLDGARPGVEVTLNLGTAGQVSGKAPCNRYSAAVTEAEGSFRLGPIAATRMACPDLALEAAYFAALTAVETAETTAGSLWLRGGGHGLHFVQPIN